MTSEELRALAWEMHSDGMSVAEIAHELGADPERVRLAIVSRWAEDKMRHGKAAS